MSKDTAAPAPKKKKEKLMDVEDDDDAEDADKKPGDADDDKDAAEGEGEGDDDDGEGEGDEGEGEGEDEGEGEGEGEGDDDGEGEGDEGEGEGEGEDDKPDSKTDSKDEKKSAAKPNPMEAAGAAKPKATAAPATAAAAKTDAKSGSSLDVKHSAGAGAAVKIELKRAVSDVSSVGVEPEAETEAASSERSGRRGWGYPIKTSTTIDAVAAAAGLRSPIETTQQMSALAELISSAPQTAIRKQLVYQYLIPALTQLSREAINPPQKIGRTKTKSAAPAAAAAGDVKDEKRDFKSGAPAAPTGKPPATATATATPTPAAAAAPKPAATVTMASLGSAAPAPTTTAATPATPTSAPSTPLAATVTDAKAVAALRENKAAVASAVQAIWSTLHSWSDRSSQLVIERAVYLCAQHNTLFCTAFANAFALYVTKQVVKSDTQYSHEPTILKLFRWSYVLLRAAAAAKPAAGVAATSAGAAASGGLSVLAKGLPVLCKLQIQLLQKFHDTPHLRKSAGYTFSALLYKHADVLIPQYLTIISSASSFLQYSVACEHLIRFVARPKQAARLKGMRAQLLKWLDEEVVGAKGDLSSSDVLLFAPFVRTLTHEEFSDPLLASIKRMFLRMPDRLLAVLRHLFPALSIDLGRYYKDLIDGVIFELRHADAARRAPAAEFVGILSSKISDSAILKSLVTTLGNQLLNRGSEILAAADNRATFVDTIARVAANTNAVPAATRQALGVLAIESLIAFVEKEAVKEPRAAAVRAVGTWLSVMTEPAPANVIDFLLAGTAGKGKDLSTVATFLQTILQLITPASGASGVIPPVGTILTETIQKSPDQLQAVMTLATEKAQYRREGLLSVAILLRAIVAHDINEQGTIWSMMTDDESLINSSDSIAAAQADELLAHAEVIAAILNTPTIFAAIKADVNNETGYGSLWRGAVQLLTHANAAACRAATKAISAGIALDAEGVTSKLIPAFLTVLHGLTDEEFDAEKQQRHRRSLRLEHALIVLCHPAGELVPEVALAAHHPYLITASDDERVRNDRVWKRVLNVWKRKVAGFNLVKALTASSESFTKLLLSESGFNSTDRDQRHASKALLSSLTAIAPVAVFEGPFVGVSSILEAKSLNALTKYEQAVYATEEGELCTWKDETTYDAKKVVTSAADRAVKAKNTGYKAADLEWERKMRAEQEKKKKAAEDEKGREAKLAEESELRTKIWRMAAPLVAVLDAVCIVARGCPKTTHDLLLAPVLPRLYPLLKDPVVAKEAAAAHLALARTLDVDLAEESTILARAVQAVIVEDVKLFEKLASINLVSRALSIIAEVCNGSGRLSSPSFMFVWPIVDFLIRHSNDRKIRTGLAHAVTILATHCQDDMNRGEGKVGAIRLPMDGCVQLLLHCLANLSDQKSEAHDALLRLCGALRAEETTTLLSDAGVLSPTDDVRLAALQGLGCVQSLEPFSSDLLAKLWIACHDSVNEVTAAAQELWARTNLKLDRATFEAPIIALLSHKESTVRYAAGLALASAVEKFPDMIASTIKGLIALFIASPDQIIENKMNIREEKKYIIKWETRAGVANAIAACANSLRLKKLLEDVFIFLADHALADTNDTVWQNALAAGLRLIEVHGRENIGFLLPLFEQYIEKLSADDIEIEKEVADRVREGVVVQLGTIARYLQDSKKVQSVVVSLLEVLKTPSLSVQRAVAECLPPLMAGFGSDDAKIGEIVKTLIVRLAKGDSYGVRKGAAFGLGAVIKGLKLSAIKKYNLLDQLTAYAKNAKDAKAREGAMLAFDRLFFELGSKFEPYVVQILPLLLGCFGDATADVREATHDAARNVMSHLTTHGVRLVLPGILRGLSDDKQWRTKLESISLLGAMAYLAPQQLSVSLPQIVQKLLDTKSDPHTQIQVAAKTALKQIGSVIRNPEIARLVPSLLRALTESDQTQAALDDLMKTSFVHSVDPASIALIVPILRSGLKSRSAGPKRMSAQVVGALCALTDDVNTLVPYASTLLNFLKTILVDPIPDVRAVAARALGTLSKSMSGLDPEFDTITSWLTDILKGDNTSVQRSGAAQGLANVLFSRGLDSVREMLLDIFDELKNNSPTVREGYTALLFFLPDVFMQDFNPLVPEVFPVVLTGLADPNAAVRETALRAGQSLVLMFARTRTDLLVPGLERGIGSNTWTIRESGVQLLGVLLLRLAGVRIANIRLAGGLTDEDEQKEISFVATKEQEKLVEKILGTERRNSIFASIYLMRADAMPTVRTAAYRVWKSVVQNTARMLQTLLPAMMNIIIYDLAGGAEERVHAAAETLADLVAKFGDLILSKIIPILQEKLHSDDAQARQGVCLALGEVMGSAHKSQISAYMTDLITGLREALCDPLRSVRAAAGRAFETLYSNVGKKAIDEIVPALVDRLDNTDPDNAALILEGMREILAHASKDVLPYLIPALSKSPLSVFHARALAGLSDVLGAGFQRYVGKVTNALVEGMVTNDEERNKAMSEAASAVVLCIQLDSVQTLIETLVGTLQDTKKPKVKVAVLSLLNSFCSGTKCNFDTHLPLLLSSVVTLFVDTEPLIQSGAMTIIESIVRVVTKESLSKHIALVLRTLNEVTCDRFGNRKIKEVPALCTSRGLGPILPMFIDALMHGTPEVREQSAAGLGELIELTSEKALAPSVIKVTGPLIRIVGDRFPANVKSAILGTLGRLIDKSGKYLKPFLPQLQTTFVKSLHDTAPVVRTRAASGLASLMKESKRVEPLLTELVTSVRSVTVPNIRASLVTALIAVMSVSEVATKIEKPVFAAVQAMSSELLSNDADSVRRLASKLFGTLLQYAPAKTVSDTIRKELLVESTDWKERESRLLCVVWLLRLAPAVVSGGDCEIATKYAMSKLKDDNVSAREAAIQLIGQLARHAGLRSTGGVTAADSKSDSGAATAAAAAPVSAASKSEASAQVDALLTVLYGLCTESKANIEAVRIGALNEIGSFAEQQPAVMESRLDAALESLVPWITDLNLDVKRHCHQTIYFLLQYHVSHDKSQALLAAAVENLSKSDSESADLLAGLAKKTLSRLEVSANQKKEREGGSTAAGGDDDEDGDGDAKDSKGGDGDEDDDGGDDKDGDDGGDDDDDDDDGGKDHKSSAGAKKPSAAAAPDSEDDDGEGEDLGLDEV